MKKNFSRFLILIISFVLFLAAAISATYSQAQGYYHIVILSDLHYPYKYLEIKDQKKGDKIVAAKSKVLDEINSWNDVNEIVLTGDIVAQSGTASEYEEARQFLGRLNKPLSYLVGNHEYLYKDPKPNGKMGVGNRETQTVKLRRFRDTFKISDLYYSKKISSYLLIYLSADTLETGFATEISKKQLKWFSNQLQANPHLPTIVFFHAPLKGTLENYNSKVNAPRTIAQPEQVIQTILHENPQVFMWVSGHTHTNATNPSFAAPVNYFEGRVLDVHNPTLDRETIYTNSLYLYPDKVMIRTYNHKIHQWVDAVDRIVPLPK